MSDYVSELDLTPAGFRAAFSRAPQVEVAQDEGVPADLRAAAVLVPVVARDGGLTMLLTRRTDHLHDHPGQVSFPGGRVDEGDASPVAAALREAEEEIGLTPDRVQLLGQLPLYRTGTGFEVTPVVGLVEPPIDLKLDAFEVAEVFEVPLAFLLDERNHQRHSIEVRGRLREYWAMPYQGYYIWGATAGMIVTLCRLLRGA